MERRFAAVPAAGAVGYDRFIADDGIAARNWPKRRSARQRDSRITGQRRMAGPLVAGGAMATG